ncbi:MAG: transposase [Deltaproteobacteria bacterium]|nr:MAG: transposase [Deltaproteobacteria bacterium]
MTRQARLDAPGTLHHVIVRGIEQRKIVDDFHDRKDFISRMGKIASETGTPVYAWALMTNHAHILLRSGPSGLSRYMLRFLSGYAGSYNRRHRRHGHLFQNRYKSIVCEEDRYFRELVRYIHLNPLRAKLVESLAQLDRYLWCGHAVLMGKIKNDWQDRDYVLKWFGAKKREAKRAYRQFVREGIEQGHRSDLVGGGLIRSQGGWSAVKAMRRRGVREKSDERILGSGEFVEQLIRQSDQSRKEHFSAFQLSQKASALVGQVCKEQNIRVDTLKSGSRRRNVSMVRAQLAQKLVEGLGLSLAETGRHIGVSPSAVAKSLSRLDKNKFN